MRVAVYVAIALVLGLLYYQVMLGPVRKAVKEAENNRDAAINEAGTLTEQKKRRDKLVEAQEALHEKVEQNQKALPTDGSVTFERLTTSMGVLVLAGPRSRDVLAKLTRADLSNEAFPWLTGQRISIGAAPVDALRVNFIGELGWEIHHPIEMQNYIFDKIMEAGAEFDIKPFGIKAMTLMALEKSYKLIPRELSVEYNAYESGLDRFISLKKPGFHGKKFGGGKKKFGKPGGGYKGKHPKPQT